ncbi:antitoxin [Gemmiger sp.]
MGTARTKANNKWNAKAYDRVNLVLKKDTSPTKDEVQAAADAEGVSLNAYIVAAISQQLSKGKP